MEKIIMLNFRLILCLETVLFLSATVSGTSVIERIRTDPDLSEFYAKLEKSAEVTSTLEFKQATIFAPTNEAFQKYGKTTISDDTLIAYHMTNIPKTVDQLGTSSPLFSESPGNAPLWITHSREKYYNEVYVNNARLLISQSNIKGRNAKGKEQVLHKIDEVLAPLVYSVNQTNNLQYNPNAWDFIENFETLNINPERLRLFRKRIMDMRKQDIFKNDGGHTFFIPIDEGFKQEYTERVDGKTIDGHVIPKEVLFTTPTKKDKPYQTLASGDNSLRVDITFFEETQGKSKITYVKSQTKLEDSAHRKGVILAQIVKANLPVRNGVIHLIHKPLMIVDSTVKQLLEEKDNGPLSKFYQEIMDLGRFGEEFMRIISSSREVTLFAPSNAAWEDRNLRNLRRDQKAFESILKMHIVQDKRLLMDDILRNNENQIYQASTLNLRKNLYFNVAIVGNNKTLSVEGGGVNATVIQPDLAATNGVVHIIDRVLGVPYTTVLDKLRTDPMLNETYMLGNRRGFNYQLNDTTRKFTYFVPRDKAWNDARISYPSAVKVLFMPDFAYHANNILERHLVVSDVPYTMERIKLLTNDTRNMYGAGTYSHSQRHEVELPTQRDILRLFVEERSDHTFIIHWKGEKIPVFRPNVECTNGVIHVIDFPFLKEGDIQVSGARTPLFTGYLLIILLAIRLFL